MTQNFNNGDFTLFVSNVRGKKSNTSYPYETKITCAEDIARAAQLDHVSALYRDGKSKNGAVIKAHRANSDFVEADNICMDCDNKQDNPMLPDIPAAEWKTPEDVQAAFPNVAFYAVPSRNHMKVKDGLPARPKYHYYFKLSKKATDGKQWAAMKAAMCEVFPAFDEQALDAARFMYGVENAQATFYPGELCIDEFLKALAWDKKSEQEMQKAKPQPKKVAFPDIIPIGQRNTTLSRFAATVLKKHGAENGKALEAYIEYSNRCEQPLEEKELQDTWNSALRNYERNTSKKPDYILPQEYAAQDFAQSLAPHDYTDIGQATVLAAIYGGKLKFTRATNWLAYSGKVWQEDEVKARKIAQELTERQLEEARKRVRRAQDVLNAVTEGGDDEEIKEAKRRVKAEEDYRFYVLGERTSARVSAALKETEPKLQIDVSDLDKDGYLLNTPDGTIDLRTGKMRPHDPQDYCTKMTAIAPGSKGAELWQEFLQRVTCNDSDLARYLQEVAGMFSVGRVLREKLIIAYGEGGNGKSTLFNLLSRIMGDYAGALSAETLTVNCRKNKSPEYAELRGKRIVIAAELEEGMRLDTSIVKKLCSTDPILAEKKYKDPFTFTPSHTVVLYTNHLPKVGTTDKGTWDRLVVVPFNANFRGMKGEIFNYADYLFDNAGGAVMAWIVEGARRFIANNYHIATPKCVEAAISKYRDNNNWLDSFLDEVCEIDERYTQKSGELYQRYKNYCDSTGDYRRSLADFKAALTAAGYDTRKTNIGAYVYGLRVKPEFYEVDEPTPWD